MCCSIVCLKSLAYDLRSPVLESRMVRADSFILIKNKGLDFGLRSMDLASASSAQNHSACFQGLSSIFRILLSKFILNTRLVRLWVVGDGTGRVLVAYDNDQRRHMAITEHGALVVSCTTPGNGCRKKTRMDTGYFNNVAVALTVHT